MPRKRSAPSPLLLSHLNHLRSSLQRLLSITTGLAHPDFPATLFHYHLLTEAQLDDLAHFYHQRTPSIFSQLYPEPIVGRWWINGNVGLLSGSGDADGQGEQRMNIYGSSITGGIRGGEGKSANIEEKRRRFGRFVGLRGCESPTIEGATVWGEEEVESWVRRRIEEGILRQREKDAHKRKGLW